MLFDIRPACLRPAALALLAASMLLVHGCARRSDDGVAHQIHHVLDGVKHDGGTAAGRVARFYGKRGNRPAWLEAGRPSADALALRSALASLPGDGVFGWEGVVAAIDSAARVPRRLFGATSASDSALARFDVRLADAWLRAASRLRDGEIPAAQLDKAWRARHEPPALDHRLADALEHHAVAESLAACAPHDADYAKLRAALAHAVRAFQRDHGLDTTGVADAPTRHAMDAGLEALVGTVSMNLERRRWLHAPRGLPRVEVNIADATLSARADTGAVLRMRVVVGDVKHPTPVFSSAIAWMDLNPTWTLSARVIAEEVVPGLRRDSLYLEHHDMIVLRPIHGALREVSPEGLVLDSVAADTFRTFIRQRAGDRNPLGRIRFMLPNVHQVYLHDTNQRGLFKRDDRARSHGCVRLQHPLDFAAWLRSLRTPTPVDSVRAAVRDTTVRRWGVEPRVPVDVLYWTAWVDEDGVLQRRRDVYRLDARMLEAIGSGHPESFVLNPPMQWDVSP